MFAYTRALIFETFDQIKRAIYAFDISIQLFYLGFLVFKIFTSENFLIANIFLASLSFAYLIFFISTTREFYTKAQITRRRLIKKLSVYVKRIISLVVIILTIIPLATNQSNGDNLTVILTFFMIIGFFLSLIFDFILALIDNRKRLFEYAFNADINKIKELPVLRSFWKTEEINPEKLKSLERIKEKQKEKKERKKEFLNVK